MKPLTAPWPILVAVTLALGLGSLIPLASAEGAQELALIVAITVVLAAPIAVRAARHEFDPFEPIVIFVAVWGLMFVVRPLVMRATGQTFLRGRYDVEEGITAALVVGLVSAGVFLAGYRASRLRPKLRVQSVRRGPPPAWVVAVPAIIGVGAIGVLGGSTLLEASAAGAGAQLYLGPLLTIPAMVLLLRRGNTTLAYALLGLSAVGFIGLGQRAFVIWPISSAFVYWYMARGKRPRIAILAAVAIFALLPLSTVLEVARERRVTPIAALSQPNVGDPSAAIKRFGEGDSTAMFPALALQMMTEGSQWQQRPGYWAYSTFSRWIPSQLWANKPLGSTESLYQLYFRKAYTYNKAPTAFTLASEFYFDLGMVGVALGMAGSGWLCGRLWLWASSQRDDPWTWALYAPVFGLLPVTFRGDLGLTLGLALFVFGPLLVARLAAQPVAAARSTSPT